MTSFERNTQSSRTPTHSVNLAPSSRTPTHASSHTPTHASGHTPTHDVSNFCTINRKTSKRAAQKKKIMMDKRQSGSIDDLLTGTRILTVPDPVDYTLKVQRSSNISEIDLDLVTTQKTVEQLKLGGDKPHLSEKALNRVSRRNRLGSPVSSSGIGLGAYTSPPLSSLATNVATEGISMSLDRIPGELESTDHGMKSLRSRMHMRDSKSASPAPLLKTMSTGNVPSDYTTSTTSTLLLPAIEIIDEERGNSNPDICELSNEASNSAQLLTASSSSAGARFLTEHREEQTRHSIRSIDSGLGESDDPTQVDRDSTSEATPLPTFNIPTLSQPQVRQASPLTGIARLKLPKGGFSSLRAGKELLSKRHRKSMLLSELCVVSVSVPASIIRTQRGRGSLLKFRFSPYTQIEFLRVAILKQFHERLNIPIPQLSKLHLCRYVEDEEGWEWLEEDQNLHQYNLPTECKLELKPLEPVYHDVRVVIPELETSMSVEYDQFSTVGDVLHQVLSLSEPPLENSDNYSLFHVRLRMHMDSSDSMVYYQILPSDVLECRLSVGRLHSVILTIKIPAIHSCRKVKVSLDETVGELISTLMRRVPDPDSTRWNHMSLLLHPGSASAQGIWMEDYKFLAAYKLKASDVIDFRPKYRPMLFELRVFPHDHYADDESAYATPELLVAQDTTVTEVISLLCNSASLEYDPRFYGLFFHDDAQLPVDTAMWDHLDTVNSAGYQDSLVLHMIHKPLKISFQKEEDSFASINVDFSQPCHVLRGMLCRRYGVHHHYMLQYEGSGVTLDLDQSLHSQGVLENESITLINSGPQTNIGGLEAKTEGVTTRSEAKTNSQEIDTRRLSMAPENEVNVWDEGEDISTNIRIDPHKGVMAATFNKLVEKLTSERDHDLEFVKTFLYTYQSFATPERLLKKLIERYNVVRSSGVSLKNFAVIKQTIQARVINALKLWVDLNVDFKDNPLLQDQVLHFATTVIVLDHPRLSKPLRTNILAVKGVIQKKNLKMFRDPPPPVKLPAHITSLLTIFDFDPEEVARQMTIIDFSLFDKIKPAELLNQAWQKPKYKHRAVNILRLVERMNNLTLWVATTILSQRDIHDRAKRISDFVAISQHLLEMHNLCTLMSLLNGLAHPSITRLKKSFSKLDKATTKKIETLQTLARPGDNFRLLRDELKRASNPCIPYLGLYMSDLTFTDNGNPNYYPDGLINFSKCRLIYSRIRDLILRQDKSYNFEEVPALHEGLTKFHFLDTDVLYDVSLQREPRDKGK